MLRPVNKVAKVRDVITYDLEWIPGSEPEKARALGFEPMQLRLAGAYDPNRGYRWYDSIGAFIDRELVPSTSGCWFYAHAGGLADLQFVFEHIVEERPHEFEISAAFSGSSAIIVKFKKGKHSWTFVDSLWLMRVPLRKIAAWIGEEKGGAEGSTETFYAPLSELRDYNERDCVILYKAIKNFEDVVLQLGGELQKTVAGTAMNLFRQVYLENPIHIDDTINRVSRAAYVASRVEVIRKSVQEATYYDINSSFPYAMTQPVPGSVIGRYKRLPSSRLYIARVDLEVPEQFIPPLPFRTHDDRVYFPTGRWQTWLSKPDVELLEECGGKLLKVHDVVTFEAIDDLSAYAEDIYHRRKSTGDEGYKQVLKILLNSLYGKFAEASRKSRIMINPGARFFDKPLAEDEPDGIGRRYMQPGVWELVEDKTVPHAHVPISMHITAVARANLTRYMREASDCYYCDTDGFAVPPTDVLPTSNELGGLKLEKHIRQAHFEAPKLYAMQLDTTPEQAELSAMLERADDQRAPALLESLAKLEKSDRSWLVKAKGFSRVRDPNSETGSRKLSYADFCDLLEGRELPIEAMSRIRGNLAKGRTDPHDYVMKKRYRGRIRPKRCEEPDGSTRPWRVDELD